MPTEAYADGQIVPHVTEKGYIYLLLQLPDAAIALIRERYANAQE
jgi:hypothetical protein